MAKDKSAVIVTIIIMFVTVISRFFGFFREITIGNVLGTASVADAYLVSLSVPNIIFANIAGAIATTYIPMNVRQMEKDGAYKELYFTNNLINLVFIISCLLSVICVIFARPILSLFAYGFNEETLNMTVKISRVVFFVIIFFGVDSVLSGYLQSNNSFIIQAAIGIPNSILVVISLFYYSEYGIMGVAYATLIGTGMQFLLLRVNSFFVGFKFMPIINLRDETIKNIFILAIPIFVGSTAGQINAMVDSVLASGLDEGSVAALNYANKLNTFIFGITSLVIATVIYPLLSKLSFQNNKNAYKDLLVKSLNIVTILLLPISVGACILCKPTVVMLFERGNFDTRSTSLTASALFYYSIGMLFLGYRDVLGRAFYSMQDTKSPMINGFISVAINVVLNLVLVRFMEHRGLALATSISAIVSIFTLTYIFKRKMGTVGGRSILETFSKTIPAVILMGIIIFFLYRCLQVEFMNGGFAIKVIIYALIVGIGAIIYIMLLWTLRVKELRWLISVLRKKK